MGPAFVILFNIVASHTCTAANINVHDKKLPGTGKKPVTGNMKPVTVQKSSKRTRSNLRGEAANWKQQAML